MSDNCNVALLGQKFMGRVHTAGFLNAAKFFNLPRRPVLHTVVGQDLIALAPFADRWGWQHYSTAWKDVVKDPAVDLVDVCSPNYMHAEHAIAALGAGKHVACEKPLATTLKDARIMRNAAVRSRRSKTFVWFNYRRCPAIAQAYRMLREERLGRIYHLRATYLQSWAHPEAPLSWRFQKKYAGSGAHGDLNAHLVDLARFLTAQEVTEVSGALAETFIPDRPLPGPNKGVAGNASKKSRGKSDVDDCTMFLARFSGGVVGSFEASRVATGNDNTNSIEINGALGSIRFNFEEMNVLWYYDGRERDATAGWRRIFCTQAGQHPYAAAWWPEGHVLGYENTFINMAADIMASLGGNEPIVPLPDFADAYETQRVLEAAMLAAKHRSAVKMSEIK